MSPDIKKGEFNMENFDEITVDSSIFIDVDPVIIRWVVTMAMAANDLSYGAKKIKGAQDYEMFYFFRLGFAHLREIAKVVGEAKNDTKIQAFIRKLNEEAQGTYKKIEELLGPYDKNSFVQKNLKNPRDETFHYPDIKGELWDSLPEDVKALGRISVRLDKHDKSIMGIRYRFIDILLSQRINKDLSKDIVDQSAKPVVHLFEFVDYVFEYLVKEKGLSGVPGSSGVEVSGDHAT